MRRDMSEPLARFAGSVTCERATGALRLVLRGTGATQPPRPLTVGFAAAAPAGLPGALRDAVVEESAPGHFRISSAAGEWTLAAPAAHVHSDAAQAFYRAIPPRPVPLTKRMFWKLVLILAGSRAGIALLRSLRGRS